MEIPSIVLGVLGWRSAWSGERPTVKRMDKYFFEGLKCKICGAFLRFYETTHPTPICLSCEMKAAKLRTPKPSS